MSDKDRRKKDGKDKNKKNQAARESLNERHKEAAAQGKQTE